ncbi:hypothetical protein JTB14_022502 [Gonioctena quinquepunctata]|nr:hypothetical protein JTB14_022502 [Gonioctena quinquepunctata]
MGLATTSLQIYTASSLKCLGGMAGPMIRTLTAKLVEKEEMGKLFSMFMIFEFVIGLGASPLYMYIYSSTIDSDPGFFNFVSAGLQVLNMILMAGMMILEYLSPSHPYQEIENEEETENGEQR